MPAMPRAKTIATQIAYKVLGKPEALLFKQTAKQKKINDQLIALETARVR